MKNSENAGIDWEYTEMNSILTHDNAEHTKKLVTLWLSQGEIKINFQILVQ
jgi:hypothetical protein